VPDLRAAGSANARALLQSWLQGPRPPEMARRRLSHSGAARARGQGGQRRWRRL